MGKLTLPANLASAPHQPPFLCVRKTVFLLRGNQTLRVLLTPVSQFQSQSPNPNESFLLCFSLLPAPALPASDSDSETAPNGSSSPPPPLSGLWDHHFTRARRLTHTSGHSPPHMHTAILGWTGTHDQRNYSGNISNSGYLPYTWARYFKYLTLPVLTQL